MAPKHSLKSPTKSKKPSTMAEAICKSKKPSTVAPKLHQPPPVVEDHREEMTEREENQPEEGEYEFESASASSEEKTSEEEEEDEDESDKSDSDSEDSADEIAFTVKRAFSEKNAEPKASTPVVNHASSSKRSAESESVPNKSKRKKLTNGESQSVPNESKRKKLDNNDESQSVPNKSKRKKLTDNGDEHDAKKGQGRVWTEQDELAIFNGLIEYQKMKQWLFTNADIGDFHQHIKKNLHLEADDVKLGNKIKKMKSKYFLKGEDQVFTKHHDSEMFELSKKIWGVPDIVVTDSAKRSNRKPKPMAVSEAAGAVSKAAGKKPAVAEMEENGKFAGEDKTEPDDFWSRYPSLSLCLSSQSDLSLQVMQKKIALLGGKKDKMLNELEEECSGIQVAELELDYKKYDARKKLTKYVLDLMGSGSKE